MTHKVKKGKKRDNMLREESSSATLKVSSEFEKF